MGLLVALVVSCALTGIDASDPDRAMSQYIRDRWGAEQGFPGGEVAAITQTPDGYLWIGTERGLVRFDGVSFRPVQPSSPRVLPITRVLGLTTDEEGNLFVRLEGARVLRYRDGRFEDVIARLGSETSITAMSRGRDGGVLLSALANGTLAYRAGRLRTIASPGVLSQSLVISMADARDGIWLGTRDAGLFRLAGPQVSAVPMGLGDQKINCLTPGDGRELWIGTDSGVVRWNGTGMTREGVPAPLGQVQALAMTRDSGANLWIGTASHGLVRLGAGGAVSLDDADHAALGAVTALFEDRERNIWVGTVRGIERLRDSTFVTYAASEGLPSDTSGPIHVDADARTWFAPLEGGLFWLREGQVGRVTDRPLGGDVIYSIAGRNGDLWVGAQRGGLTHLGPRGNTLRTYTQADGLAQNSVYAVHEGRDGTVWAGTLSGGVSRLRDGRFTTYTTAHGLASNTVASILESSDRTLWFATPDGLTTLSRGRWRSYGTRDGLPSENVGCLFEDATGVIWIGTGGGLAFLAAGRVQTPRDVAASLHEPTLGIAEDRRGSLWIATASHVVRVTRDVLIDGTLGDADIREYGLTDGLRSVEGVKRHQSVVADPEGRIWLSMRRGLSVVDPAREMGSSAPALVQIQSVTADGSPIDLGRPIRLPAASRRLAFGYAGLSLAAPERVRFKYRLDSFDTGWSPPVTSREAVYTNLRPGSYEFRVIASNSDGVWSASAASLTLAIEPLFWQTWWFRLSSLLACGVAGLALYRFRVHQLARRLSIRFEERLAERTRIAQELHDTLLQGFLSASMQLHVVADRLPEDAPARVALNDVLQLMRRVIDEGRNAVRGLRPALAGADDLEQALSRVQQELGVHGDVASRVIVEGKPRRLKPMIRDEIYRIGREALVNAFRHARAARIEVELDYARDGVRLLVRDDGAGIDPHVLQSGREGHWGLSGMRERADSIGAHLKVWSRAAAGTEVELSVPGHIAFEVPSSGSAFGWLNGWRPKRSRALTRRVDTESDE